MNLLFMRYLANTTNNNSLYSGMYINYNAYRDIHVNK